MVKNRVFLLDHVPLNLLATCIAMCGLHCYVRHNQHLLTNLQETSSAYLRQTILLKYVKFMFYVCVRAHSSSSRVMQRLCR